MRFQHEAEKYLGDGFLPIEEDLFTELARIDSLRMRWDLNRAKNLKSRGERRHAQQQALENARKVLEAPGYARRATLTIFRFSYPNNSAVYRTFLDTHIFSEANLRQLLNLPPKTRRNR